MIRGDYHIHSEYSFDCCSSLPDIINRCQQVGLNSIALTDHNTIEGALRLRDLAKFQVIIGEEVSSMGGHIIGLFIEKHIPAGLSVKETVQAIKEQNGITIAPHPFSKIAGKDALGKDFLENISIFDCIEIRNSNNLYRPDDYKAEKIAKKYKLRAISGSDAHSLIGLGSNLIEMSSFEGPSDFLDSLEHSRLINRIHPSKYFIEMLGYELTSRYCKIRKIPIPKRKRSN